MRNEESDTQVGWRDSIVIVAVIVALAAAFAAQAGHAAEPAAALKDVLQEASRRFDHQDYLGAQREYELATRIDAGSLPAWRGLGWSHWRLGDEDRALEIWNDILKVEPDDPETLLSLAQAAESREDWARATEDYTAALRRAPKAAAYVGRARIRQRFGRYKEAEADLREALKLAPADFDARYLLALNCKESGRLDESRSLLDALSKQGAGPRAYRAMADVLLELDRADEALAYYRKNLALHPDNRGTIQGIARAQARLQRYPEALATLEKYVAAHPEDANMRDDLVRVATASGDHERAARHLRVLARQQPGEGRWALKLARSLRDSGHPAEADRIVAKILARDPRDTGALEFRVQQAMLEGSHEETVRRIAALTEADPTPRRLVRLGGAWINLGDEYADRRELDKAQDAHERAAKAFLRAAELDPQDSDAVLGAATALRLSGDPARAVEMAQRVADTHPGAEPAWREIYEAQMTLGDYAAAEKVMARWRAQNPRSVRLRQDFDRTHFKRGKRDAAIADLQALLHEPIRKGVPVLLYHGITETAPGEDAMPLKNFRDQMRGLKREGYTAITLSQLVAWHRKGAPLPPKPVLITFDDARADSFRYADPVLQQYGLRAVMFAPTAEVGRHGDYNAPWSVMRKMRATGRWDIQCHSHAGHAPIPVDADGKPGAFLVNRMWLKDRQRLETRAEFEARLDADYRQCAETLRAELPGTEVSGYAFPFGEYGQKAISNEPEAGRINGRLVQRYYQAGFVQDTAFEATRLSDPMRLERFEVPWDYSGPQLVSRLRSLNPYVSTQLLIADLYSWDGRYQAANGLLDKVARSGGTDRADLLTRRARVVMWQGDFAEARAYLNDAVARRGQDPIARQGLIELDQHVRPQFSFDGDSQSDNHERDSLSLGPDQKAWLTDRALAGVSYRYKEFGDGRLAAAGGDLRATGHELQAALTYRTDWRTSVRVTAGYAQFEDDSTLATAQEPVRYTPYSFDVDVPIGDSADYAVRLHHGYVDAAGAVLTRLQATGLQQQLELRPRRDMTVGAGVTELRYDDGNQRTAVDVKWLQRIVDDPDLKAGYRFRYDDASDYSPYFYTPDRYVGNDAVAEIGTTWRGDTHFGAEASVGAGQERGSSLQLQTSISGTVRHDWRERLNVYLTGGRWEAADYRSYQVLAGLAVIF